MAWDKKPLPGTPLRREVMGMKLKWMASGIDGTVKSHSQWLSAFVSPPLFELITVIPCNTFAGPNFGRENRASQVVATISRTDRSIETCSSAHLCDSMKWVYCMAFMKRIVMTMVIGSDANDGASSSKELIQKR